MDDPENPENNGKVFLFRYGAKIFNKLQEAMSPEFDEEPMNPFCPWEGADFVIRIRMVEGFRNYDKSDFKESAKIGTDKEIEKIWEGCYSLQSFLNKDNFKSYNELSQRLRLVLGDSVGSGISVVEGIQNIPKETPPTTEIPNVEEVSTDTDEDLSDVDAMDDLDYFNSLSED